MEIERKYILDTLPFELSTYPSTHIVQSYISFFPTLRIRQRNDIYFLTAKGRGHMAREEFEIEITKEEYLHLHEKIDGFEIAKQRYLIPLEQGLTAELDVYENEFQDLYTVEVEFSTVEEADAFVPPAWFGRDVTMEKQYKNSHMAQHGKI
ncbi:MAG: CYTH domain-containing protein [Bacillota bacterium]